MDKKNIISREDFRSLILEIEKHFPINNWKINDLHLWPYIRIQLFFYLINVVENKNKHIYDYNYRPEQQKKFSFIKSIKEKIILRKWLFSLPKKEIIYVGADVHRVDYEGMRFNRFFDSLNLLNDHTDNYLYLEYEYNAKLAYYRKDLVFNTENRITSFTKSHTYDISYYLDGYEDFLNFLQKNNTTKGFAILFSEENLKENAYIIYYQKKFYEKILKEIKPKEVNMLCFYGKKSTYSLIAAANSLGIKTVEMQHGPQPDLHLSYTNWSNIPEKGYDMLPRNFHQWDDDSVANLETWTTNNRVYNVQKIGHPWVELLNSKVQLTSDKDFILYCLQPEPVKLSLLFNNNIIKSIKSSNYKWYIRLHPRQLEKIQEIQEIIDSNNITEKVNISEATRIPLPSLLKQAKVVVTHSSGVVIEAELLEKKIILINKLGISYHRGAIERKNAIFIDAELDSFPLKLSQYISTNDELT